MTFGCCIFYSAFIGDLFSSLAQASDIVPAFLKPRWAVLCALGVFPLLPLCLLKNLSALQYTSMGGLASVLYSVGMVVKRSLDGTYAAGGEFYEGIDLKYRSPQADPWASVGLWHVGPGTVTLMNMACVAFMAHYNGVKYYEELEHRTVRRYTKAIGGGVAASMCVFVAMMLFGFRTFGTAAQPLLLNNYHRSADPLVGVARFATGCAIVCGYPIMFSALKTSSTNAVHEILNKFGATRALGKRFLTDANLRTAWAVGLLAVIIAIACDKSEEDVADVVGLIGALLGSGANFIIPAVLNLQLFRRLGRKGGAFSETGLNRLLVVAGFVFMYIGTKSVLGDASKHHHH
eukprot:TRINITY_DN4360_c0_g1_i1.p2 TRINITY_DN4360_c0_g1~~TRINITY_DN4360_c0_g1_i1.p2  ORF type:complete len:347 (-),score=146.33 TRINITY_DN4360_c0_g1_i1:495-1535(-)